MKAAGAITEQSWNVQNMFPQLSVQPVYFIFHQTGCSREEFGQSNRKTISYHENPVITFRRELVKKTV